MKETDVQKAAKVNQEVDSRGSVMHIRMSDQ